MPMPAHQDHHFLLHGRDTSEEARDKLLEDHATTAAMVRHAVPFRSTASVVICYTDLWQIIDFVLYLLASSHIKPR
jgi:hypothetical protein